MNPYQDGKIYRLDCGGLTYIGSTIQSLEARFCNHGSIYNRSTSEILFEIGIPVITLIENYPCDSKRELEQREQFWIEQTECVNQQRAFISEEDKREWRKKYREQHRAKIDEYMELYREQKRTELLEYAKKYREQHKEKILEYKNTKIICDICGDTSTLKHITRHKKSLRCIRYVAQ